MADSTPERSLPVCGALTTDEGAPDRCQRPQGHVGLCDDRRGVGQLARSEPECSWCYDGYRMPSIAGCQVCGRNQ